jgi:hypothetical protein
MTILPMTAHFQHPQPSGRHYRALPGFKYSKRDRLLDVDEPRSTSELADPLNISTQTLRNNETYFADFEATGVIQREDFRLG